MGCLPKVFKGRDGEKKLCDEEKNNPTSSGECSRGDSGTNTGTSSVANSGTHVVFDSKDPIDNQVEGVADPVVEHVDCDSTGTVLTQSGSLRKPNDLRDFSYQELKHATKNFDRKCLLGEGGFGQVFRGSIKQKCKFGGGEEKVDVAVKQLNSRSQQGHKEWLAEVHFLGLVDCPHLVKLIGYCATDDDERGIQRLLVYEFMPNKGLDDHLFLRGPSCLSWASRVKIVLGAARGLAYLHEDLEIQIIFRDFKTSNVLLDEYFEPKLSDFGLARQGPQDGDSHVSTAVVGTAGYAAPEYIQTGHLTVKSDVWSFGIVMLEVLTGRRVMDRNRPKSEQRLVEWAKPFISDHHKLFQVVDPALNGRYPVRPAQKFAQLAYQCLHKFPKHRPKMSDVVGKLVIVQERTELWENPASHSDASQELARAARDSPRGLSLGSLPSVRSGKVSKFSPRIRDSGGSGEVSRHISNLSLEGHSVGGGGEPKLVDSSSELLPKLVQAVVEEAKPADATGQDPKLVDTPEPGNSSTEKPQALDAAGEQPKAVDASIEEPKLGDAGGEEPKGADTAAKVPKPGDTVVVEGPKLVDTDVKKPKLVDAEVEKPKLVDAGVDEAKLVDAEVEKPKLMDAGVEEAKLVVGGLEKLVNAGDEEPKLVEDPAAVKRRSWGSDRLARMSRESGRFTWIPKLYGSLSS